MKKISPKSLAAVLAAAIREDADAIALQIVEQAKSSETDFNQLVARYITGESKEHALLMSQFANNIFDEVKAVDKFKRLKVGLIYEYGFHNGDIGPLLLEKNYEIILTIDEKRRADDYFNIEARGEDENAFVAYDQFKASFAALVNRNLQPNDLIIESPIPTTPEPTTES